ncbi:MAG: outer membrane protein assembly factor BamA [Acidobacteriota bacterium]
MGSPFRFFTASSVLLVAIASHPTVAQETDPVDPCGTIASIEVRGNSRMSADAVRFDLELKKGDAWDEARVQREFRRFWERGYFSDLRFFRRCEPQGTVLVIEIKERPTILSVSYEKNKVLGQQQIEDHYKERDFTLSIGTPMDRKKLWRAESLIEELLGAKGYLDPMVKAEIETVSPTARKVTFRIRPGGKTRIRAIDFTGNAEFSDRVLRKQLKLTQPRRWWWPFGSKSLYHPLKFGQDVAKILEYYRDRGYLDVDVKPPITDFVTRRDQGAERKELRRIEREQEKAEKARKEALAKGEIPDQPVLPTAESVGVIEKKSVALTVPISEGSVYKLGDVKFEGNTVYPEKDLRLAMPLKAGAVLSDGAIDFGLQRIRALYGTKGYVYASVSRRFERKEGQPVADVIVEIDEDQPYTVRRIDFVGNNLTQDEVLRREMNVTEGELIDKAALTRSMDKLRQLGYWQPSGEADLQPVTGASQVDVKVHGEEQSRNEIQVGGGYSELDGGFFLASYSTRNFLGRGDTLNLSAQVGGRASRASIQFVEPWFLGKPYLFSFSIFRRDVDFGRTTDASGQLGRLRQRATGGSVAFGKKLGDYTSAQLEYQYQSIEADTFDISRTFDTTTTRLGTLSPSIWYRNIWPDIYRPTRGYDLRFSLPVTAEVFGADVNYLRPRAEVTVYKPLFRRFFVAAHVEGSWIRQFGSLLRQPGYIDGVPRFDRFYLGGDTLGPRVFETRTISPIEFLQQLDSNGNPVGGPLPAFIGGTKMLLAQFELGFPIGKTATIAGFADAGGVYPAGEDIGWDAARVSAGFEFRVFLPVFQAPIRLIYGWPIKEKRGDRTSSFQFSIGLPF